MTNVLPLLGWTWLLVVGAEGIFLIAEFFFGPWLPLVTARSEPVWEGAQPELSDATTLGLIIALVVANSLFVAAVRQFGDDKPAITKFALFLAAAFVLTGAFVAVYEAKQVLAVLMLWTGWMGIVIAYIAFWVFTIARVFRSL